MFGGIEDLPSLQIEHANFLSKQLLGAGFWAPTADSPTADTGSSELGHMQFPASKSLYYVSEDRGR